MVMNADLIDMPKKRKAKDWTPGRIKALRIKLGLTQSAAAARVEASRRLWFYWESGERIPGRCHLRLIDLLSQGKV